MKNNKLSLLLVLTILVTIMVFVFVFPHRMWETSLVNPPAPIPSTAPPQAPKTFQFDKTTDLKGELDKVNPEVLDFDFE